MGRLGQRTSFQDSITAPASTEWQPCHRRRPSRLVGCRRRGLGRRAELCRHAAQRHGRATYAGHAIGTVANSLNGHDWITYVATGDMDMTWNFGSRDGRLRHHPFRYVGHARRLELRRATMSASWRIRRARPNGAVADHFAATITGCWDRRQDRRHCAGSADGSLCRQPGTRTDPNGVIGNWNIGNDNRATTPPPASSPASTRLARTSLAGQ